MKKVRVIITEFGIGETTNMIVEYDYFKNELDNAELGNTVFIVLPNRKNATKYINPKFVSNIEIKEVD